MKGWKTILIMLLGISLCTGSALRAQDGADSTAAMRARYGVHGGVNVLMHDAEFSKFPGTESCCGTYSSGKGTGFSVGFLYEYPVLENMLAGVRLDYDQAPARFVEREPTTFIINGKATPGAFEHLLEASYGTLVAQPIARYRVLRDVLGRYDLLVHGGVGLGLRLNSEYHQRETIVEPEGYGVYVENGTPVRNEYSGSIPDMAGFSADLRLGISLDVPVNSTRTVLLSPELSYVLSLSPVVRDISWNANSLRFGLVVMYRE